ncbi:MAG: D-2-hydroxyacid dehydrogenase [Terriglobales bacterium]
MKILIVVYHPFELWQAPPWFSERLRQDFPGVEVVQRKEYGGIEDDLRDADIAITWSLRPEQFRAARKLRWIHSPAAAVHALLIPEIVASDVVVTNARDVHGPVVAEHAIALVLALAKRLPSAFRYQQESTWAQDQIWRESPHPREIAGATLGLVGLGSIGLETAKRAAALGMKVIAVREHADKPHHACVSKVFVPNELDEMLRVSDYVVLAAPLTPRTRAPINRDRLLQMKPDAYLINVSRGALIDQVSLLDALGQHRIAGAALDVFEKEPLPPDSPLWKMANVVITPHTAALTDKLWERHYVLISENLRRFLAGAPQLNIVNKARGY